MPKSHHRCQNGHIDVRSRQDYTYFIRNVTLGLPFIRVRLYICIDIVPHPNLEPAMTVLVERVRLVRVPQRIPEGDRLIDLFCHDLCWSAKTTSAGTTGRVFVCRYEYLDLQVGS